MKKAMMALFMMITSGLASATMPIFTCEFSYTDDSSPTGETIFATEELFNPQANPSYTYSDIGGSYIDKDSGYLIVAIVKAFPPKDNKDKFHAFLTIQVHNEKKLDTLQRSQTGGEYNTTTEEMIFYQHYKRSKFSSYGVRYYDIHARCKKK